ncbi:hypothetical protein [Streptomyces sp. NBC_00158]|uniref:hypothetical protein n=1 Tax=Streptomyces sp. NBC_00158 TaxID=2903627 RepID=UPI00324E1E31
MSRTARLLAAAGLTALLSCTAAVAVATTPGTIGWDSVRAAGPQTIGWDSAAADKRTIGWD